jgi:CRISPR-associated protein Csd1
MSEQKPFNALQSLVEFAKNNKECNIADEICCYKKIDYNLVLNNDGIIIEILRKDEVVKIPNWKSLDPEKGKCQDFLSRTSNIMSNLIVDKIQYVIGINDTTSRGIINPRSSSYRELHLKLAEEYPDLQIIKKFLDRLGDNVIKLLEEKKDWKGNEIVMFSLFGEEPLHEKDSIIELLKRNAEESNGGTDLQQCSVCCKQKKISRLMPKVKGIPDSSGMPGNASLMSCNSGVAEAYDKEQGDVCPTCEDCVAQINASLGYMLSKNVLLERYYRQAVRVGSGRIAIFWSDNQSFNNDFHTMMNSSDPDEIRKVLEAPEKGLLYKADTSDFNLMVVSRNMQRVIVHSMFKTTIAEVQNNIYQYFKDLEYEGVDNYKLWSLYMSLIPPNEKSPNKIPALKTLLEEPLFKAAITGEAFPNTLLFHAIQLMKTPDSSSYAFKNEKNRCAIMKAVINRNVRLNNTGKEVTVSLDENNKESAYLLGRYFSVSEFIQKRAQPNINRTVKDSYFNMMMSFPSLAFKQLDDSNRHSLRKLTSQGGYAVYLNRKLQTICNDITDIKTQALTIGECALFILGYNHQTSALYKKAGE